MTRKTVKGKVNIGPSITLNEEIYDCLAEWADDDDRSVSAQIAYLIRKAVREKYGDVEEKAKIVHRRPRTSTAAEPAAPPETVAPEPPAPEPVAPEAPAPAPSTRATKTTKTTKTATKSRKTPRQTR